MDKYLFVFDVDDTLYLERDYVLSGFTAVGDYVKAKTGFTDFTKRATEIFASGGRSTIFDRLIEENTQLSRLNPLELVAVYREHAPKIAMLDDAAAFIETVKHDATLAVVTDGPAQSQRAKVQALTVSNWASEVVITSERGEDWPKPSTRSFQHLQDSFGVCPERCVYFGDNPSKDFQGPRSLGWKTVRIRRPNGVYFDTPIKQDAHETHTGFSTVRMVDLFRGP